MLYHELIHVDDTVFFNFKGNHFTASILMGGLIGNCKMSNFDKTKRILIGVTAFSSLTAWTEACLQDVLEEYYTRYSKPYAVEVIEKYFNISRKFDLNFAQMSIKFCEIQKFVTSTIIGATTMEQLKTDIESVNVDLSKEIIKEINEVQKIYPNPCP